MPSIPHTGTKGELPWYHPASQAQPAHSFPVNGGRPVRAFPRGSSQANTAALPEPACSRRPALSDGGVRCRFSCSSHFSFDATIYTTQNRNLQALFSPDATKKAEIAIDKCAILYKNNVQGRDTNSSNDHASHRRKECANNHAQYGGCNQICDYFPERLKN